MVNLPVVAEPGEDVQPVTLATVKYFHVMTKLAVDAAPDKGVQPVTLVTQVLQSLNDTYKSW